MKPGRKPIPRAERLSRGLPVCIVEGCHRAPNGSGKRCSRHPDDVQRAAWDGTEVMMLMRLPRDLHAAAKARAAAEQKSLALLVVEALSEAAKTWGTPT